MDSLAQKNAAEAYTQSEMVGGMAKACERLETEILNIQAERGLIAAYFYTLDFLDVDMLEKILADYDKKIADRQGELSDIKKNMRRMRGYHD